MAIFSLNNIGEDPLKDFKLKVKPNIPDGSYVSPTNITNETEFVDNPLGLKIKPNIPSGAYVSPGNITSDPVFKANTEPLDTNPTSNTKKEDSDNTIKKTYSTDYSGMQELIDRYKSNLDDITKSSKYADLSAGLINTGVVLREMFRKPSTGFVGASQSAPNLYDPSNIMASELKNQMKEQMRGSMRQLSEMGRSDLVPSVLANYQEQLRKQTGQTAATRADFLNKQSAADTEAANKNAMTEANVVNMNIKKQIQENLASGKTVTQALQNLTDLQRMHLNTMSQAEQGKLMADIYKENYKTMAEKEQWSSLGSMLSGLFNMGG